MLIGIAWSLMGDSSSRDLCREVLDTSNGANAYLMERRHSLLLPDSIGVVVRSYKRTNLLIGWYRRLEARERGYIVEELHLSATVAVVSDNLDEKAAAKQGSSGCFS